MFYRTFSRFRRETEERLSAFLAFKRISLKRKTSLRFRLVMRTRRSRRTASRPRPRRRSTRRARVPSSSPPPRSRTPPCGTMGPARGPPRDREGTETRASVAAHHVAVRIRQKRRARAQRRRHLDVAVSLASAIRRHPAARRPTLRARHRWRASRRVHAPRSASRHRGSGEPRTPRGSRRRGARRRCHRRKALHCDEDIYLRFASQIPEPAPTARRRRRRDRRSGATFGDPRRHVVDVSPPPDSALRVVLCSTEAPRLERQSAMAGIFMRI